MLCVALPVEQVVTPKDIIFYILKNDFAKKS